MVNGGVSGSDSLHVVMISHAILLEAMQDCDRKTCILCSRVVIKAFQHCRWL